MAQDPNNIANGTRLPGSEIGENSLISGTNNAAMAPHSAAIGSNNKVEDVANSAVALGDNTIAYSPYQLVHGKYNALDANNIHAHIVGGGKDEHNRKNIYTLDWDGNATFAGKVSFAGDIKPTEENDLVNLGYLKDQIAIKFFPHRLSEDGLKSYICVNDLEAYTIYKVKRDGQSQVMFVVKTESGREVPFYAADLSINRHSMFVGEKTDDKITFFLDSTVYTIDLKTGKLTVAEDQVITTPGAGGSDNTENSASIDDDTVSPSTTWSSNKIAEILNDLDSTISNAINRVEVLGLEGQKEYMVFYNGDEEVSRIELPYVAWKITEEHVLDWNKVQLKVTAANEGKPGQILSFDRIDENKEIIGMWVDPQTTGFPDGDDSIDGGDSGTEDGEDEEIFYATDAEYVRYRNGDIINVKQALDKLLYVAPAITAFNAEPAPGNYEIGTSIEHITFTWTVSKAVGYQSITDIGSIDPELRSAEYNTPFDTNKKFTLSITEDASLGNGSASKEIAYNFMHKRYWGVSAAHSKYDSDFISSLSSSELATDRQKGAFNISAGSNQYIYYCFPAKWGTPTFNVGGFDGGFNLVDTASFTNSKGYVESYVIWRSDNPNLGTQTIIVK